MTTETIEHLREINIRQAERIERLESDLIKERAHSKYLTDELLKAIPHGSVIVTDDGMFDAISNLDKVRASYAAQNILTA